MSKTAYEQIAQARLRELDAEIEKLRAQADAAKAETRGRYQTEFDDLEQRRQKARSRLSDLERSGDAAWEVLKAGVEQAWDDLSEAIKAAKSGLR